MNIRNMLQEDLAEVFRIQIECFNTDLVESNDSVISKYKREPRFLFCSG